jgi:hypothetical protein
MYKSDISKIWFQEHKRLWKESLTLIVNNSININKTCNHLWPQIIEHKNTTAYDVENPGIDFGQAVKGDGVTPDNEIQQETLLIYILLFKLPWK